MKISIKLRVFSDRLFVSSHGGGGMSGAPGADGEGGGINGVRGGHQRGGGRWGQ